MFDDKNKMKLMRRMMAECVERLFHDHFKEDKELEPFTLYSFMSSLQSFGYTVFVCTEDDYVDPSEVLKFWTKRDKLMYFYTLRSFSEGTYELSFDGCGFDEVSIKTKTFSSFLSFFEVVDRFYDLGDLFKGRRYISSACRELFQSVLLGVFGGLLDALSCDEEGFGFLLKIEDRYLKITLVLDDFEGVKNNLEPFRFKFEDSILVYPTLAEILTSVCYLNGEDFRIDWN